MLDVKLCAYLLLRCKSAVIDAAEKAKDTLLRQREASRSPGLSTCSVLCCTCSNSAKTIAPAAQETSCMLPATKSIFRSTDTEVASVECPAAGLGRAAGRGRAGLLPPAAHQRLQLLLRHRQGRARPRGGRSEASGVCGGRCGAAHRWLPAGSRRVLQVPAGEPSFSSQLC